MSDSDNYLKILEKMGEIAVDTGILKNEVAHIKENLKDTQSHVERINQQDIEQNKLLDQHILGVKTAMERLEVEKAARMQNQALIQKQMEEIDSRLKKAENFPNHVEKIKKISMKIVKWASVIAPTLAAIYELREFFK